MHPKSCPQCGNTISAPAIRCPRCNKLLLAPCGGNCGKCHKGGCS